MKYAGMTVIERLYVSGYMDEYDNAVKDRDSEKVKDILQKVELKEESINDILKETGL